MTSSATETDRERRAVRRAALRAVHPDLGGDAEKFIAVMRVLEQSRPLGEGGSGTVSAGPTGSARGAGAAPAAGPGAQGTRPVVTSTVRSRTARRLRRARRRLRDATGRGPWPRTHFAVLDGHPTPSTNQERA